MIDVWDLNTRVIIAFSLVMIVGLLTYIAFFKEGPKKTRSRRSSRK